MVFAVVVVVVAGSLFPITVFVVDVVEAEAEAERMGIVPVFVFDPGPCGSDDDLEGRCTF